MAPVLGGLLLVACGGGGGGAPVVKHGSEATDVVRASAGRTQAAGRARMRLALGVRIGPSHSSIVLAGRDAFDNSLADLQATIEGQNDAVLIRVRDGQVWIGGQQPAFRRALPAGKSWVTGPFEEFRKANITLSADDNLAVLLLVGGARDAVGVGTEDVGGARTAHYRFGIDFEAAVNAAPESRRAVLRATMRFHGTKPPQIGGEAFLDDQGRLRRLLVKATADPVDEPSTTRATDPSARPAVEEDLRLDVDDLGTPFTVDVPPANQTVPLSAAPEVLRLLRR